MLLHNHSYKKPFIVIWWRELFIGVFLLVALGIGGFPSKLSNGPQNTLFFELFIKDVLLVVVIGCIFFYIQMIKAKPERIREYFFLNSLPITDTQLALHFLLTDIVRYSWLPGLTILMLFSLTNYAPIPHILRVGILIFLLYTILLTLNSAVHFKSISHKFNPLSALHPVLTFLMSFLFLILTFAGVLLDSLSTGFSFWLTVLCILLVQLLFILFYLHSFKHWHLGYKLFHASKNAVSTKIGASFWRRRKWQFSPLLIKNMLKIEREKSLFVLILTAVFVLCGYLVSRNNQRLDDFLAVLNASVILYAVIFAYRLHNVLSTENESTQIIFALPIRRTALYLSTLIPPLTWMFLMNSIFFLLALTANIELGEALVFWFKSFGLSAGFIIVSLNFAFTSYPETKSAQTNFLYWGLLYLALMALFFKYWHLIFLIMVALTFLKMFNKKMYLRS